jgi:hypothetical protein
MRGVEQTFGAGKAVYRTGAESGCAGGPKTRKGSAPIRRGPLKPYLPGGASSLSTGANRSPPLLGAGLGPVAPAATGFEVVVEPLQPTRAAVATSKRL